MKKLILSALASLVVLISVAQPPAGDAKPGDWYGEKVSAKNSIDIAAIPAKLETKDSFNTKVVARILEVCPKKGCWLKLAVNDSTTAFVKMKDYGFFLPVSATGKTVLIDGEVKLVTTSVEELRHYAEDAKKSQAQIDAIVAPKKEIRFLANGITVVK